MFRQGVWVVPIVALVGTQPVQASIGFAEWEITTPGGNYIGKSDLYPVCGTCLVSRPASDSPTNSTIHASQVRWWRYYPGYITGQADKGYFLFDERSKAILYVKTDAALTQLLNDRHLNPVSKVLTPQDGWEQTWKPILDEMCRQSKKC